MKYIAIDIDDTLNNFSETLKTSEFTYEDQDIYNKYIAKVKNDVIDEGNNELMNLRHSIHLQCYKLAKLKPGALDFMQWLKYQKGYTIVLLTYRDLRYCIDDTKAWLKANRLPYDYIFKADNKIVFCNIWKIPILIDDAKVNIISSGVDDYLQLYYPICTHNENFVTEWTAYDEDFTLGNTKGFHNFEEVKGWMIK